MAAASITSQDTAEERALTARQVADILGVAEITLQQWRARGEGPRYFRAGRRHIRYRFGDVIAWRDARTVGKPQ
jgi:predicted DNA-binding transcriptional regulator AlpA